MKKMLNVVSFLACVVATLHSNIHVLVSSGKFVVFVRPPCESSPLQRFCFVDNSHYIS